MPTLTHVVKIASKSFLVKYAAHPKKALHLKKSYQVVAKAHQKK